MMARIDRTSLRAAATAALLLVTGGVMGVLLDRHWLAPRPMEATPLTAESIAERLRLQPADEARLQTLLDSLHTEMLATIRHDPDALGPAVHAAQRRIEAALPPEALAEFRALMKEHHEQMMRLTHRLAPGHGHRHGAGSRANRPNDADGMQPADSRPE